MNESEVCVKPVLTDRHDGVVRVIEIQEQSGGDPVILLDDAQVAQLALAEQASCGRVIIEIGHTTLLFDSIRARMMNYAK